MFDSFCHDASGNTCFLSWVSCRCQQPDVQIHWLAWKPAMEFPVGFFLMKQWSFKLWVLSQLCLFLAFASCCIAPGLAFCFCLILQIHIGQIKNDSAFRMVLAQAPALCTNQGNLQCFVAVFGSYKAVNVLDCAGQNSCWVGQCWQPASCCLVPFPTVPVTAAVSSPTFPPGTPISPEEGQSRWISFPLWLPPVVFFLLWLVTINALLMCVHICVRLKY